MKLWTMQTRDVWESLQRAGVFRCDTALCWMAEELPHAYSWLAREMTKKGRPAPARRGLSRLGVVHAKWQAQKT